MHQKKSTELGYGFDKFKYRGKYVKKFGYAALLICFAIFAAGCSPTGSQRSDFESSHEINVISREDGSGTRVAFVELFKIREKYSDGTQKDLTTKQAVIAKQTDVMMLGISGDRYAVGYISLGSMNDTVKPLEVDRVAASPENVKNGSYPVFRPFILATNGQPDGLAEDFIRFVMSREGQAIVAASYISPAEDTPAYRSNPEISGKIVVAGSSSVTPIVEKLKETYVKINPNVSVEIQMSDSSSGMNGLLDRTCDIGMSSRALGAQELERLVPHTIALDAIAIVANPQNPVDSLTGEQVKDIFTGRTTNWSQVNE